MMVVNYFAFLLFCPWRYLPVFLLQKGGTNDCNLSINTSWRWHLCEVVFAWKSIVLPWKYLHGIVLKEQYLWTCGKETDLCLVELEVCEQLISVCVTRTGRHGGGHFVACRSCSGCALRASCTSTWKHHKKQCRNTLVRCPPPREKQEAVQKHCGCDVPTWSRFGEHDPLWRMENMTPPHPGNRPTYAGQPAMSNHKSTGRRTKSSISSVTVIADTLSRLSVNWDVTLFSLEGGL